MTGKTFKDRAAELTWFHAIDFGDFQSSGRHKRGSPPNASLYGVMDMLQSIDLTSLHCVDIGAVDGLIAFNLKSRGAAYVVATDVPSDPRPTFLLVREALGLDVEFSGNTMISDIVERLGEHRFDLVVCAGVIYHMFDPLDAVLKARRLLKRNGIIILQSLFLRDEERALMAFNPVAEVTSNVNTFWVPSLNAMKGMLMLGGFDVLASRSVQNFSAALGVNKPLDELDGRPTLIEAAHLKGMYPGFKRELPREKSTISYRGPHDHQEIVAKNFTVEFFPHPASMIDIVGSTYHRS